MSLVSTEPTLNERALQVLRRAGNPFRNYFARNPDDEVCSRFHVPELFRTEREQLLAVVDLYRYDRAMHSEMVPVLGNKGSGKTHLLHSIKHGQDGAWQLLVTPGVYQKDTDFLEYLLFQIIDTLLGGGKQKGTRPLEFVGAHLVRRLLHDALESSTAEQRLELFPVPGLGRWTRRLGLGNSQAQERAQWLKDQFANTQSDLTPDAIRRACGEITLDADKAFDFLARYVQRTQGHDTSGLLRRQLYEGFARAVLRGDEAELASFMTYGFAELPLQVRPSRQELVLSLLKVMMDIFLDLKMPVVIAFDQLEDLLLARRSDDGRRVAEAFFAGIVQAMHQVDGLCFLVFAERGLWNRFVPSLDGYIQDRLNNPIHLAEHGTVKALRLEAPLPELVRRVVEARLRPALEELPDFTELPAIYPFSDEQVLTIARTEPTLRDMLQQFRHLFDHLIYGGAPVTALDRDSTEQSRVKTRAQEMTDLPAPVKSVIVVETPIEERAVQQTAGGPTGSPAQLLELWNQEVKSAREKLVPEGALTGATRELQAGLGSFLQICHEHGVKVGPWRLQHVVPEWTFGDHPTYGAISIGHWACKDGQPWKVGIGLFLGRGPAKPKDLAVKLSALDANPPLIDHLILLRPEDDLTISGKSKTLWQESERKGRHARLEAVGVDGFATLYGFPRWLAAVTEGLPQGRPVPNVADLLQERCEKLLEQICMPVQGG
jgi:hypothetical protein